MEIKLMCTNVRHVIHECITCILALVRKRKIVIKLINMLEFLGNRAKQPYYFSQPFNSQSYCEELQMQEGYSLALWLIHTVLRQKLTILKWEWQILVSTIVFQVM